MFKVLFNLIKLYFSSPINPPTQLQFMVPMAGIGPATSPLPRECSTTEPHGLLTLQTNALFGAGDEARTRDIQFGKLKLYQLSYSRTAAHQINYYTQYI